MAKVKKKRKEENNELKFYSLDRIKKCNAHYNVIFGMRSNGKTYAVQYEALKNYVERGEQMAIIRRYDVDYIGKRGQETFRNLVVNKYAGNRVEQLTNGEWTDIIYWSSRWYLAKYNEKGDRIRAENPFCYAFCLSGGEHDKSTSYPNITTILFDEFITRNYYLPDEFVLFTDILSTIIRERDNVTIYMCGNTVNKYNPYFKEMGLDNAGKMEQGDLQVYQFAVRKDKKSGKEVVMKVAVEYADNPNPEGKPSDIYFAFNNPKLQMITNGVWELALYPHLPIEYKTARIDFIFFIIWEGIVLQCEVMELQGMAFIYIHAKTTPLKDIDNDLIYSTEYNPRYNWRRKLNQAPDEIGRKIKWLFDMDKVFYQDNEIGDVVRNYRNWCKTDKGIL